MQAALILLKMRRHLKSRLTGVGVRRADAQRARSTAPVALLAIFGSCWNTGWNWKRFVISATGVAAAAGRREEGRRAAGFAGAEVTSILSTSFNAWITKCKAIRETYH